MDIPWKGSQMRKLQRLFITCVAGLAVALVLLTSTVSDPPLSKGEASVSSIETLDPRSLDPRLEWNTQISPSEVLTAYLPLVNRYYCIPPGELWNPDLEPEFCTLDDYQSWDGISGFIAPYWQPFVNDTDGDLKHPEFNKTDRDYRRYSGDVAQQFGHSAWGDFEAGIYQVVTGTQVGDTLRFTIYGLGWIGWNADSAENDRVSDFTETGGLSMRIGIDPYGGESFTDTQIVWSAFVDPYDVWHQFEVTATAAYSKVSVWAHARPATRTGTRFKQTFWDQAELEVISAP
jgi:hypothetical protein